MSDDVGSLLLRAGLVDPEQLQRARSAAEKAGGTVPEELVRQGHVGDEDLTAFYRSRLLITRVNPSELSRLSPSLLQKLPADMASEYRSIPVHLDKEGNMTLIMSDPSDTKAAEEISFFTGTYIMRAVATQAQIAWCLAHYYKHETHLYRDLVDEGAWPSAESKTKPAKGNLVPSGTASKDRSKSPSVATPPSDAPSATVQSAAVQSRSNSEAQTAPMKTQPKPIRPLVQPPKAGTKKRVPTDNEEDEYVGTTEPLKVQDITRRKNQKPNPAELSSRSGEFQALPSVERKVDKGEGIQICLDDNEQAIVRKIQRGTDTAPIVLSSIKEDFDQTNSGPIVLDSHSRKRRSTRQTSVGLGVIGSKSAARAHRHSGPKEDEQPESTAKNTEKAPAKKSHSRESPKKIRDSAGPVDLMAKLESDRLAGRAKEKARKSETLDNSWDDIGVAAISSASSAAPPKNDDENVTRVTVATAASDAETAPLPTLSSSEMSSSETSPSGEEDKEKTAPAPGKSAVNADAPSPATQKTVKHDNLAGAATKLLLAVRSIDGAKDKRGILEPSLGFLDLAFERTGFLAIKQDVLSTWLLHGCADDAKASIDLDDDSSWQDVVRTRLPYNGPIEDGTTKRFAETLDIPDAMDMLALPVIIRERVVGVIFGLGGYDSIFEEHLTVLSQVIAEAFERILLARK